MFEKQAYLHLHIKEEVGWGSIYMILPITALLWTLTQTLCSIIHIFKYTGQHSVKTSNIECDSSESSGLCRTSEKYIHIYTTTVDLICWRRHLILEWSQYKHKI